MVYIHLAVATYLTQAARNAYTLSETTPQLMELGSGDIAYSDRIVICAPMTVYRHATLQRGLDDHTMFGTASYTSISKITR